METKEGGGMDGMSEEKLRAFAGGFIRRYLDHRCGEVTDRQVDAVVEEILARRKCFDLTSEDGAACAVKTVMLDYVDLSRVIESLENLASHGGTAGWLKRGGKFA